MSQLITDKDRERAKVCLTKCKGCKTARKEQKGFWFWFVKNIEPKLHCPYCKAYTKVYGRKAWEPLTKSTT